MTVFRKGKRKGDKSLEPGQDSFLDVVANLIGILIILVMLIGTQAKSVWEKLRAENDVTHGDILKMGKEIDSAKLSVTKLKSENNEIESSIIRQKQATQAAKQSRDRIQLALATMKTAIDKKKKELSKEEQEKRSLVSAADRLRAELETIQNQTASLQRSKPKLGVIDHLPTPIAKTVFGKEVHFRLKGGKLVYVPLDELVVQMRSEWKVKAKKLVQTPSTVETVGPIDDFRLQYKLILQEQTQKTENGTVRAIVPALDRFILLPVKEDLGEIFDNALAAGSQFANVVNSLDPNEATISVWVYPDSYGQFNQLKRVLYEKGFLCAGWPLPENQPISGSPNGFRTAAQ